MAEAAWKIIAVASRRPHAVFFISNLFREYVFNANGPTCGTRLVANGWPARPNNRRAMLVF